MFLIAMAALMGVVGLLLWYTHWAEARILDAEPKVRTADSR